MELRHEAVMTPPDVVVDLSIFELFKNAHIVVKFVMIGLLLASVWSWAIIFDKLFLYRQDAARRPTSSSRCSGRASRWRSSIRR